VASLPFTVRVAFLLSVVESAQLIVEFGFETLVIENLFLDSSDMVDGVVNVPDGGRVLVALLSKHPVMVPISSSEARILCISGSFF